MPKPALTKTIWSTPDDSVGEATFRKMLSNVEVLGFHRELSKWLSGRGWKPEGDEWKKDGMSLLTAAGFDADREACALYKAFQARDDLSIEFMGARPDVQKQLRLAYEAGLAFGEALAYQEMVRGRGRPRQKETQFMQLDRASAAWKRANSTAGREPSARELGKLAMGVPQGHSLASLVSEWRRDRARKNSSK